MVEDKTKQNLTTLKDLMLKAFLGDKYMKYKQRMINKWLISLSNKLLFLEDNCLSIVSIEKQQYLSKITVVLNNNFDLSDLDRYNEEGLYPSMIKFDGYLFLEILF